MKNINEIGILACGTRMKRLYDLLVHDARALYAAHDLDLEPKWFTIIYTLSEEKEMTVTELSNSLGLAHPTIIQYVKELEKTDWVVSAKSKTDGRLRLVRLSKTARKKVPELTKIWDHMRQAFEEIGAEGQIDFWEGFNEFEASLLKKSFLDRVLEIHGRHQRKNLTMKSTTHPGQWFERKFDFENLSTTAEGLMERLRFTPLRVQEQIRNLSAAQLTQEFEGKWSVQENIGHLNDLEPLWHGRIIDIINGETTMRPADLTNKKSHEAGHDLIPMAKLLSNFTANRNKLLSLCEEHYDVLWTASALHPRLKTPMRIIDLLYFVAEHDDHHLATNNFLIHQM
ncbi:MAG: hypothetical protein DHS20C18_00160 [Saprospiraceae bacterium]|nr:MAG: hypothetical protein DHS20C18_00160 [Saprospiraceae bacterium]